MPMVSRNQHELGAERRGNRESLLHQGFKMGLGGDLELKNRLAPVTTVRVTPGEKRGLGYPDAVFIATEGDLGDGDDHKSMLRK